MGRALPLGLSCRALPKCVIVCAFCHRSCGLSSPEAVSLPPPPSSGSFSQPGALTLKVLEQGVGGGRDTGGEKNILWAGPQVPIPSPAPFGSLITGGPFRT